MSEKLLTLEVCSTVGEANILRSQLEANGIRAFVMDDQIVTMAWYYGIAVGGVKVQVGAEDFKRADSFLEEICTSPVTEEEWDEIFYQQPVEAHSKLVAVEYTSNDEFITRAYRSSVLAFYNPLFIVPLIWSMAGQTHEGMPIFQ